MQINSFSHFRAISILLIMAGHSYRIVGLEFDTLFDVSIKNLITGATSLFVFISGFLFYCVFYPEYQYKKFLVKKVCNVLTPYLILGFVPICFDLAARKGGFDGYFLPDGEGLYREYLVPALKYYASGRSLTAYWYIPFIMITFSLSPIHIKYIDSSLRVQLLLIFVFSIISIFAHRPIYSINPLHSALYFTPVYLIGITAAIYKDELYLYLKGKDFHLFVLVVLLAVFQALLGFDGNFYKPLFEYGGIDIMYFQKIAMCFFFMAWLNRFEEYNNKFVQVIASTSFTAFFIHPFVLLFLFKVDLEFIKLDSWFVLGILVLALSLFCILVAKVIKTVFPKHSKYIVGY